MLAPLFSYFSFFRPFSELLLGPDGFSARSAIFCRYWTCSFSGRNNQAIGPRLSAIFTFLSMHPPTPISHFLIFSFLISHFSSISNSSLQIKHNLQVSDLQDFHRFRESLLDKGFKRGCCFDNPFVWWATQKFIFSNFSNVKSSKDCKTLKFRKCLKTGQLNRLYNHLIYKAFSKTRKASSILASPFNPLAYKALSVLLKACPYTFFRPFGRICLENLVVSMKCCIFAQNSNTIFAYEYSNDEQGNRRLLQDPARA